MKGPLDEANLRIIDRLIDQGDLDGAASRLARHHPAGVVALGVAFLQIKLDLALGKLAEAEAGQRLQALIVAVPSFEEARRLLKRVEIRAHRAASDRARPTPPSPLPARDRTRDEAQESDDTSDADQTAGEAGDGELSPEEIAARNPLLRIPPNATAPTRDFELLPEGTAERSNPRRDPPGG